MRELNVCFILKADIRALEKMMKLFITLLFSFCLLGCSAISSENNYKQITQPDARNIAGKYLKNNNLLWGEPTSIRESHKHYIFFYLTPDSENKKVGGRILNIHKVSGGVSLPPRL